MTSTERVSRTERIDRFAEAVSLIFHPLIVVIPTMVIVMLQQGIPLIPALSWTFLSAGIANLPLAFLIVYGVRSGHYSDVSVSIREQRRTIYAFYGFSTAVLLAVLVFGGAPLILTACWVSAILTTIGGYVINRRFTKLSLHSVGMAGCATVLVMTVPTLGLSMALFALLVAWARIRLKHHTPAQIVIGWLVPTISVLVVFRLIR